MNLKEAAWDRTMDINLKATYLLTAEPRSSDEGEWMGTYH